MNLLKTITSTLADETLHVFAALSILVGGYQQQRTAIANEGQVTVSVQPDTLKKSLRKRMREAKAKPDTDTPYWNRLAIAREVAPYAFESGVNPLLTPHY